MKIMPQTIKKTTQKAITQRNNAIEKLGMFNVVVKEIDKVKDFYISALGFKLVTENKYGESHFIKMDMPGGNSINLIKVNSNGQKPDGLKPGVMQFYLVSSDINQSFQHLKELGIKLNNEIQEQQWDKKVKQFDFNDPDGNQWFIVQFLN